MSPKPVARPVDSDGSTYNSRGRRKLHRQIESRIRQHIEEKHLVSGSQLPTEAELCRQFKVSRSTVRNALKRLEEIGLITRTRGRGTFLTDVTKAIAVHDEPVAQNGRRISRTRQRNTIGVVLSFASEVDVMQMSILLGIEHAVKSRGYNLLFARTDEYDEAGEARAIDDIFDHGVRGLIALPIANHATTRGVRMLVDRKLPVVLVDRYLTGLDTGYVASNNLNGAYLATQHLILLGYTCFEFILPAVAHGGTAADQLATTSIRDRFLGFCQALRDYGRADCIHGPLLIDVNDLEQVRALLKRGLGDAGPVALFALHDLIAIPLINTAAQVGLKPPIDFAIVGFDDLPFARHLPVPLTTVAQPRYDIGFRAGHLLIDKIEDHPIRSDNLSLPVSLVVRESCGAHERARRLLTAPVAAALIPA